MRSLIVSALVLSASVAGATAQPGTLWSNNDYIPGTTAGSAFSTSVQGQSGTLPSDDFFLDPADLEAAADPNNPDSCPEFRITQIRTRMFPRAEIADRPWILVLHRENALGTAPEPVSANATVAMTPPPVAGPLTNTGEVTISQSAVDAIWDFSAAPITLAPGAYWLMAYKDTTGAQAVGWWSPFPSSDQRNTGKLSAGNGVWNDQDDFDFDVDGMIVDPCPLISSQTIRGKSMKITDASAGSDATRRRVRILAREKASANTLVGDPTVDGATLEVVANGSNPSAQTFSMPAALWRASSRGDGFRYRDPSGSAGPVTAASLRRTVDGLFLIRAQIDGRRDVAHSLEILPPDAGTDAFAVLRILNGDRYCVKYGTDGTVKNSGARSFRVSNPTSEGCP